MVKKVGPIIKTATIATHGVGGVKCLCCRCCTCVHIEFLKTAPGIVKAAELILNFMIEGLLFKYGLIYHAQIGLAFQAAVTASSACFLNSALLLLCYVFSEGSYKLMKSSLFEIYFNSIAFLLCTSSASGLRYATNMFLWHFYLETPGFDVYPAMVTTYHLTAATAVLYAIDTYLAFIYRKSLGKANPPQLGV